jgi:hypothetical protein
MFAGLCQDGSLQLWRSRPSKYFKPDFQVKDAHGVDAMTGPVYAPAALRQAGVADTLKARSNEAGGGDGGPTCVRFAPNGNTIATRGGAGDDSIKLWDVRMLRAQKPIVTIPGIRTLHDTANVAFSDDSRYLVAGKAVRGKRVVGNPKRRRLMEASLRKDGSSFASGTGEDEDDDPDKMIDEDGNALVPGEVHVYDTHDIGAGASSSSSAASSASSGNAPPPQPIMTAPMPVGVSPIVVEWHRDLNQIAVGCSDGKTRMMYNPAVSKKGALLCAAKAAKARPIDFLALSGKRVDESSIYNPHALKMYQDAPRDKAGMAKMNRKDPIKSKMPAPPPTGCNRVRDPSFTHHYMQSNRNDDTLMRDPRESLLKYAEELKAEGTKTYVDHIYDTKTILASKTVEQEEADAARARREMLDQ